MCLRRWLKDLNTDFFSPSFFPPFFFIFFLFNFFWEYWDSVLWLGAGQGRKRNGLIFIFFPIYFNVFYLL